MADECMSGRTQAFPARGGARGGARKVILWICGAIAMIMAGATFAGARGCEEARVKREIKEGERIPVVVAGKTFKLEPAFDDPSRMRGLGGRAKIEEDGGMMFIFPIAHRMEFVMRDCLTDIDIAFVDDSGRVLTMHEMKMEEPRRPDEPVVPPPGVDPYDVRLKRYGSRFPCRIALEFAGGTLRKLGVKEGDKAQFHLEPLKARVR
ncbi:MAG: DUF192 domain-containing protein [Phycisphaerales bacterium]